MGMSDHELAVSVKWNNGNALSKGPTAGKAADRGMKKS
jgi:hypothetical protein